MTPAELCTIDPVNVSIHFLKKWTAIFNKLITGKDDVFGEVEAMNQERNNEIKYLFSVGA